MKFHTESLRMKNIFPKSTVSDGKNCYSSAPESVVFRGWNFELIMNKFQIGVLLVLVWTTLYCSL